MRIENSLRNISYSIIGQIISNFLSFINRTVFVYTIGISYLGITGLFSNIFALLSLAELGVGTAISYSLYKPLAQNDRKKVSLLMQLYGKAYKWIGISIGVIGTSFTPFLGYIIKDRPDIEHLELYYLLMLSSTVVSYFYSYKRTILLCDQKAYIDSKNRYTFMIVQTLMQIVALVVFKSFILYLVIATVCTALSNVFISHKANKEYPFLKETVNGKIDIETKAEIKKNIFAMMFHKISGVIVYSSDNVIISKFIGLSAVGLYSNYYMIINIITTLLGQIFNAITASVANLNVLGSLEVKRDRFMSIYFVNFWIATECTICLYILLDPFISLWIGNKFLLDKLTVIVLCFYFFNQSMRHTVGVFKNSAGLYWNDRYKPIFESVINLVASIILLQYFGIAGVFMGTIVSLLTTSFWVEPFIVYKHVLKMKFRYFLRMYVVYTAIFLGLLSLTSKITSVFAGGTIFDFIGMFLVCLVLPNICLFLLFFKTKRFRGALIFAKPIFKKLHIKGF